VGKRAAAALIAKEEGRDMRCIYPAPQQARRRAG
jgi:hypothetical protein